MLDNIDEVLSKKLLIKMHIILKRGTIDEDNPRYNVGGLKVVPNFIGLINIINTSDPEDAEQDLKNLLHEYNSKKIYL